ncbi:unnamed protein product [Leuciscus chuanchicus]
MAEFLFLVISYVSSARLSFALRNNETRHVSGSIPLLALAAELVLLTDSDSREDSWTRTSDEFSADNKERRAPDNSPVNAACASQILSQIVAVEFDQSQISPFYPEALALDIWHEQVSLTVLAARSTSERLKIIINVIESECCLQETYQPASYRPFSAQGSHSSIADEITSSAIHHI